VEKNENKTVNPNHSKKKEKIPGSSPRSWSGEMNAGHVTHAIHVTTVLDKKM
jgi:hypothetical protein